MKSGQHLAIIGSGASSIYLLKHLLDGAGILRQSIGEISVFEKTGITGMGMPYNPGTTDRFNMSNISSEELPALTVSFGDWLRSQEPEVLRDLDLENIPISDSEVYNRLALGRYLNAQYKSIVARLAEAGIRVHEHAGCEIADIRDQPAKKRVTLISADGALHEFDRVVIATGHRWPGEDQPAIGYYASPWPISKLLPREGGFHDFEIGTLGASLSAFDVISSIAHRHGQFVDESGRLSFHPYPGSDGFKIVMHSAHGLLPHLQFDQEERYREIYRHVDRYGLLGLVDASGFLRLETYFDKVCRPALLKAFEKDGMLEMVKLLAGPGYDLSAFVQKMTDKHDYENAFEGMRFEMTEAKKSVLNHQPIHWKEVLDDLMYTLNFHAELMPAEDHIRLKSEVMPFVMNVVAALPLPSGNTLLALYDAGKLDIMTGKVSIDEKQEMQGRTGITVEDGETASTLAYRMFIDCSGQKALELEEYPFPSLVKSGAVRKARAFFAEDGGADSLAEEKKDHLFRTGGACAYHIGGAAIDGAYRVVGSDGEPNPRIYDIAFPHTSGVRPYSYGLQACNDTSAIVVRVWVEEITKAVPVEGDMDGITRVYEKV